MMKIELNIKKQKFETVKLKHTEMEKSETKISQKSRR